MKRIVKTVSASIILALILSGNVVFAALADDVVKVVVNTPEEITPGSTFIATVDISEVFDLNAVQYDISFDPTVLQLDDVSDGHIGSQDIGTMYNEVGTGKYRIVQSIGLNIISGSGQLATLHLRHISSPGDIVDLNISGGILSGITGEIPATWTKGTIRVKTEGESNIEPTTPESETSEPNPLNESSPVLPISTEPEDNVTPNPNVDDPLKAPQLPSALQNEPGAESTPDGMAKPDAAAKDVINESTEPMLYPPNAESRPVNWPIILTISAAVIAIIALVLLFKSIRRNY